MKKVMIGLLISFLIDISIQAQNDKFTDPRDGKEYYTIKIGTQTWMRQNLTYAPKVTHLFTPYYYENGKIRHVYSLKEKDYETHLNATMAAIYCYDDDSARYSQLGMLYTWTAAIDACPVGWHLPSEQEFEKLLLTVGGGDMEKAKQELNIGGSSGFQIIFGGQLPVNFDNHLDISKYVGMGKCTAFWTSTEKSKFYARVLGWGKTEIDFIKDDKGSAYYVRCIKDSIQ